jgi:hypothetical protein
VKPRQPLDEQVPISADACLGDESGQERLVASRFREAICLHGEGSDSRTFSTCGRRQAHLAPQIGETLYVTTRADLRRWFQKNHHAMKEIWLIQYKKATGKPSIDYVQAVEEAICFGWIDGFERSMDAERYATRFTPRRPKSNWTETNKERARRMIAAGKMTKAGLAVLPSDLQPPA